jgi:hypothetical protein
MWNPQRCIRPNTRPLSHRLIRRRRLWQQRSISQRWILPPAQHQRYHHRRRHGLCRLDAAPITIGAARPLPPTTRRYYRSIPATRRPVEHANAAPGRAVASVEVVAPAARSKPPPPPPHNCPHCPLAPKRLPPPRIQLQRLQPVRHNVVGASCSAAWPIPFALPSGTKRSWIAC